MSFEGVGTREAAEALRGDALFAEPVEETGDDLYVHELIGKVLADQHGTEHGLVVAVEANPASDLLVLEGGGLVPLRFVASVNGDRIVADVPDGLFE